MDDGAESTYFEFCARSSHIKKIGLPNSLPIHPSSLFFIHSRFEVHYDDDVVLLITTMKHRANFILNSECYFNIDINSRVIMYQKVLC